MLRIELPRYICSIVWFQIIQAADYNIIREPSGDYAKIIDNNPHEHIHDAL